MRATLEQRLAALLAGWVRRVGRWPRAVAAGLLAVTVLLAHFTATHLGVSSDNLKLLAPELPFLVRYREFAGEFPVDRDPLLVLVEGPDARRTRAAAERLAEALGGDSLHVRSVFLGGSGAFFERFGLLYRSPDELEDLSAALVQAQPLIAALERDPQLSTLVSVLEQSLDAGEATSEPDPAFGSGPHWSCAPSPRRSASTPSSPPTTSAWRSSA